VPPLRRNVWAQTDFDHQTMTTAVECWRRLPSDVDREVYFQALGDAVREYYLVDASNPLPSLGFTVRTRAAKARSRQTNAGVESNVIAP
jgi:hypothetical protein